VTNPQRATWTRDEDDLRSATVDGTDGTESSGTSTLALVALVALAVGALGLALAAAAFVTARRS
jgi:hypothetical protein